MGNSLTRSSRSVRSTPFEHITTRASASATIKAESLGISLSFLNIFFSFSASVRFPIQYRQDEWPSVPRPHQTLLAHPPLGAATRDEGPFQPKADVDWFDTFDLLGHEPDAIVWYRVLRYLRYFILAAYDVGEEQRNVD